VPRTNRSPPKKSLPGGAGLVDILSITEAAALLGVSAVTLRRWDASGRFVPHRHPVNGRRIYRRSMVLKLRRQIEGAAA
jgi:DNA-binding transcriptional MerR regulator